MVVGNGFAHERMCEYSDLTQRLYVVFGRGFTGYVSNVNKTGEGLACGGWIGQASGSMLQCGVHHWELGT